MADLLREALAAVAPPRVLAALELAESADSLLRSPRPGVVTIKASPPTFSWVADTLGSALAVAFGTAASPPVVAAANDLAALKDAGLNALALKAKAKTRVKELAQELAQLGKELPDAVVDEVAKHLTVAYRLGLTEVSKPLGWELDWTLPDRDALHSLHQSGLYWIGEHYGQALDSPAMLAAVEKVMLTDGLGRRAAGRELAKLFGGQIQRSDAYWSGLASVMATRSRTFGALRGMARCGGVRYEFVNPDDERTSTVCRRLNGTLFTVKGGVQLMEQLLAAESPEAWKAIAPWPKAKDLTVDGTEDGELRKPGDLQASGIAWPPLHMHCRSSIDVRIWQAVGGEEVDPFATVADKPPAVKPPPIPLEDVVPAPVKPPPWEPTMPAYLVQGDVSDGDWLALIRLQGYAEEELAALLKAVGPDGKDLVSLIHADDLAGITGILSKVPPTKPIVFPEHLIPHKSWAWHDGADLTTEAGQGWVVWLGDLGYSEQDALTILGGHSSQVIMADSLIGVPVIGRPGMALWLLEHPPESIADFAAHKGVPTAWVPPPPPPPPPKPPKVPKKAPPPPPTPVPDPVPPPVKVPAEPVTQAADVTKGPVDVHGGYAWVPSEKPPSTNMNLFGQKHWLKAQGYSPDEAAELAPILKATPGSAAKLALLWKHPPASSVAVSVKPQVCLSPAELGTRLLASGKTAPLNLGGEYTDSLTGEVWWVRYHADEAQARAEVAANVLYRKLGVEVPEARLVQVGGNIGVANRRVTGWESAGLDTIGRAADSGFGADAYLGNWNVVGSHSQSALWVRTGHVPGPKAVLRIDNGGVMSFRATGAKKPFGSNVVEIDTMLDSGKAPAAASVYGHLASDKHALIASLQPVAKLDTHAITEALDAGGFQGAARVELHQALVARRANVIARIKALEAEIVEDQAAARAAEGAAAVRRSKMKGKAAGKATYARGVDLRAIAATHPQGDKKRLLGPVAAVGDGRHVRDQRVRIAPVRFETKAGVNKGRAMDVQFQLDEAALDDPAFRAFRAKATKGNLASWTRRGLRNTNEAGKPFENGEAVLTWDVTDEHNVLGSGLTLERPSYTIQVGGSGTTYASSNNAAIFGHVRIIARGETLEAQQASLEAALKELGRSDVLTPPSVDDEELMLINRALWNLEGGSFRHRPKLATARADLRRHGLGVEDLEISEDSGYVDVRAPGLRSKVRSTGTYFLYHEFSDAEAVVASVAGLDGGSGGLVATTERFRQGLTIKGASSEKHVRTGGGNSVFTRVVSERNGATGWMGYGNMKALIAPDELERLDWYAYNADEYGTVKGAEFKARSGAAAALATLAGSGGRASNEVMLRWRVDRSAILAVGVLDKGTQDRMVRQFTQAGITQVRGRPVREFFPIMRNPKDFSDFKPANPAHAYLMRKTTASAVGEW